MLNSLFDAGRYYEVASSITRRLVRHRRLLYEQVKHEVLHPHAAQMLSGLWLIVQPLFLMLVYVFVFAVIFQARIGGTREMPLDYTTYILAGVIPWLAIQQALTKSCTALTGQANLIKQVVFPIEVLPAKTVLASFIPLSISMLVLIVYVLITNGAPPVSYAMIPVLVFIQLIWGLGLGFLLSAVSIFVRDTRELVQMFATAGLFLLPIIYLPQWVPAVLRPVLYVNPFSYLIWIYQDVLYFGRFEHPWAWVVSGVLGVLFYLIGTRVFMALKPHFGDAL